MNQDLALACREDIKGRFGTKRTSSQLWSGECGFGRAQLAKMSRANPEIETEWVSQDVMKKVVRFGLFKEGIWLYMWASFNLFFHSSDIYWSLYLLGFSRETGVCVCVCVCVCLCVCIQMYTHRGIWLWRLTSPKIFNDVVLVWVWCLRPRKSQCFSSILKAGKILPSLGWWAFLFCLGLQMMGGSPSTLGRAVCFTQSVDSLKIMYNPRPDHPTVQSRWHRRLTITAPFCNIPLYMPDILYEPYAMLRGLENGVVGKRNLILISQG